MTDIHRLLRDKNDKIVLEHDTAQPDVFALLETLQHDVLPQVAFELALTDSDIAWLSEWLSDNASIFRLLRRHKFTRSFALQDIRAISIWRIRILRPILLLPAPALLHCLPPPITDPLGHPMVFFKLASLQSFPCSVKDALLQEIECLRLHLRYIRDHCTSNGSSPLQFLVLIDLEGISMKNYDLDLCSWFLTDVIPRYPGMLAAVFVLNYSWVYLGAWSVVKRLLPSSIIARVFFPSKAQLCDYCSPETLPADYGGSLPALDQTDNALHLEYHTQHLPPLPSFSHRLSTSPRPTSQKSTASGPSGAYLHHSSSKITLPPFSHRNPFFGYPASASASSPHRVHQVQRGWPELAYMLAVLWWRRWGRWTWACICLCGMLVLVQRIRRARLRVRVHVIKEMINAILNVTFRPGRLTAT